jgi:N-methylhydantoinase B/oxoprolinase/acetone carboxylase alpha subunit
MEEFPENTFSIGKVQNLICYNNGTPVRMDLGGTHFDDINDSFERIREEGNQVYDERLGRGGLLDVRLGNGEFWETDHHDQEM